MPSKPTEHKQHLRQAAKQIRHSLSQGFVKHASDEIVSHLCDWEIFDIARNIAIFAPLPGEPDLTALLKHGDDRHRFAFPRIDSVRRLQFHFVSDIGELNTPNRFGIAEPMPSREAVPLSQIDLLLVPALALDPSGNRLGFGGGYYDRMLAEYSGVSVGVVFAEQMMPSVPSEIHDRTVDFILTQKGIYCPAKTSPNAEI